MRIKVPPIFPLGQYVAMAASGSKGVTQSGNGPMNIWLSAMRKALLERYPIGDLEKQSLITIWVNFHPRTGNAFGVAVDQPPHEVYANRPSEAATLKVLYIPASRDLRVGSQPHVVAPGETVGMNPDRMPRILSRLVRKLIEDLEKQKLFSAPPSSLEP